jgi:hypothetical protein
MWWWWASMWWWWAMRWRRVPMWTCIKLKTPKKEKKSNTLL